MSRLVSLVVLMLLAACTTSTSSVQPPPRPGIAAVRLVTDSGTMFTGHALPAQRLVAQIVDSAGNTVTGAVLSLAASPGWTVRSDTLIAPTTEATGTVRVTASEGDLSSATDSLVVAAVFDLTKLRFVLRPFACHWYPNLVLNDSVGALDSTRYWLRVDSVTYSAGYGPVATNWGLNSFAWLYADSVIAYHGLATATYRNQKNNVDHLVLDRQVPDTIGVLQYLTYRFGPYPSVRSGVLPTYVFPTIGILCDVYSVQSADTTALIATVQP